MRENTFYNLVFSHYQSSTYNSIHYKPGALNAPIINSNNLLARAILRAAFRFSSSSFSCKYAIKRGQTEGEDLVSKFCLRNASNLTYQISRPVLFIKRIVVARQICKWTLNAPPEITLPPFLSSSISNRSGCTTYARSYRRRATLIPLLLFLVKIYYGTPLPLFRPAYSGGLSQAQ